MIAMTVGFGIAEMIAMTVGFGIAEMIVDQRAL
jgi:hypothetical protein